MPRPLIDANLNLTGFNEVKAELNKFSDEFTRGKLLDNACAAGARVLSREIQGRSPSTSVRRAATVRKGRAALKSVRVNKASQIDGLAVVAFRKPHSGLVHLIEFGTSERIQKSTGRRTGRMPARPFIRPAIDTAKDDVVRAMAKNLRVGIKREFGKVL